MTDSNLNNLHNVSVRIFDKLYQIRCPADKVQEVQDAAQFLDAEMRKVKDSGVFGLDRITIMAALNIAYEFLCAEKVCTQDREELLTRIQTIHNKIQERLTYQEQMEL